MSKLEFNVPPTARSYGAGPRFKVSSEKPEKRAIDLAIPGLIVLSVIHYITAAPTRFPNDNHTQSSTHTILKNKRQPINQLDYL